MTKNQINEAQKQRSLTNKQRWGVILAGGDGVRLRSLTRTISGDDRPKQFSPLLGGHTLLAQTRLRIARTIDPSKTTFVLTKAHEPFFAKELATVSPHQMMVQPANKGTLPAILWALLRIARIDADALVALFPSDHYYADEEKFMAGVISAFDYAESGAAPVILLGAVAKHAETEYGWIEPDSAVARDVGCRVMRVKHFWEKPSYGIAEHLLDQGCLWNTFVMVGRVVAFLAMIRHARPDLYGAFEPLLSLPCPEIEDEFIRRVYDELPASDFSKEVLAASTDALTVAGMADCGWSDLGDPRRLITTLHERGIKNPWVDSGICNRCGLTLGSA